jgi:hypothetical protein
MKALEDGDIHEGVLTCVRSDFDARQACFGHDRINNVTEKRFHRVEFWMSAIHKAHKECRGRGQLGDQLDNSG